MTQPLVLASQSFSRRAMLDAAGVSYDAQPAHVDEDAVKQALLAEGQGPRAVADALAQNGTVAEQLEAQGAAKLAVGSGCAGDRQ